MTQLDILQDTHLDSVFLSMGMSIYSYEYVESLRDDKLAMKKVIIPWAGSQEEMLSCSSDLIIDSGLRGSGKTAKLCMGAYSSIEHPNFSGMIFRREINDAKDTGSIADVSKTFYNDFGYFLASAQNMTWNFNAGGSLKFGYYSDSYDDFVTRVRGKGMSYIGVDELTQMKFKYFRFLFSNNRNSVGLHNQIIGTCNPDGDSWVYRFVGGRYVPKKNGEVRTKWLDEDGYPIPEMNGRELYFFIYGDRADQIYWGETRTEVVDQAREELLNLCQKDPNSWKRYQNGEVTLEGLFVLSCSFFTSYTTDNKSLDTDDYIKRIAALSPEERARDLGGRWARRSNSSSLINMDDMEKFYGNSQQTDQYRCVTADISLGGKDVTAIYLWEGFHLAAVETCKMGAESLKAFIDQLLERWGIPKTDFCFDATGIGSGIAEYFNDSMQFDARTKAFDHRNIQIGDLKQMVSSYENVKAQCIDNFARRIKNEGYSIRKELLHTKFESKMLIDHFNEEYVSIARDYKRDGRFKAIDKREVINAIGHSPDFMDAMYIREYVELDRTNNKRKAKRIGVGYL